MGYVAMSRSPSWDRLFIVNLPQDVEWLNHTVFKCNPRVAAYYRRVYEVAGLQY
jgi:hypothetical protein